MTRALIVVTVVLLFTACQKKSPQTNTYYCVTVDSIPSFSMDSTPGIKSNLTNAGINLYMKENTSIDTENFNGVMRVDYKTTTCELDN